MFEEFVERFLLFSVSLLEFIKVKMIFFLFFHYLFVKHEWLFEHLLLFLSKEIFFLLVWQIKLCTQTLQILNINTSLSCLFIKFFIFFISVFLDLNSIFYTFQCEKIISKFNIRFWKFWNKFSNYLVLLFIDLFFSLFGLINDINEILKLHTLK